tara:strand:+ start:16361 stop:17125 length:765 start_codon:yes stop_codon:yes gene_type:complete
MKISINNKILIDGLTAVLLKGKYPSGASTKNKNISEYALLEVLNNRIEIYNADSTTGCCYSIPINNEVLALDIGHCILDIPKTVKYLKAFKGVVTIEVGDVIRFNCSGKSATIPLTIIHPHLDMINMVKGIELPTDDTMPTFGKNQTPFECKILVQSALLVDATNTCDVTDTGIYNLEATEDALHITSPSDNNETISVSIDTIQIEGEEAGVSIAGPFSNFMNSVVIIYMKDDFPILMRSPNRLLLKAPRFSPR